MLIDYQDASGDGENIECHRVKSRIANIFKDLISSQGTYKNLPMNV